MEREMLRLRRGPGALDARFTDLTVHCAWGGRYELRLDECALTIDDEAIAVAAPGRRVRGAFRAGESGSALTICYPPGTVARLMSGQPLYRHAAEAGWREHDGELRPPEHIRACPGSLQRLLREIVRQLDAGICGRSWFEEQADYLLRSLLRDDLRAAAELARARRPAARRALLGRLSRITDLIHSEYERRLTLGDFARAAHLSTYHMLRQFKALHGRTPYEYLQQRRLTAALRLLRSTREPVERIAERVGFADRRSFDRLALRTLGGIPDELRREPL
jgi:AraC-like DNA-binding protein